MQAGGGRFESDNLHQSVGGLVGREVGSDWVLGENHYISDRIYILALADKKFFKNLEEVNK